MTTSYVYLFPEKEISYAKMNLALQSILKKNFVLRQDEKVFELILHDGLSQVAILKSCYRVLCHDLLTTIKGVIVPKFNEAIKRASYAIYSSNIVFLAEFLPTLFHENKIHSEELYHSFSSVSKDVLDTIKTYVELNMSVVQVSKVMYTHRNTINYRINRFIELTGIDVRDIMNALFIYLVITWK